MQRRGARGRSNARTLRLESLEARSLCAADTVTSWNSQALAAIRATQTSPPVASRALAILHVAIFDALNAIERTSKPYAVDVVAQPDASRDAAIASAGHRVLSSLFPTQSTTFDTKLTSDLSTIPDGKSESDGVALGRRVADTLLQLRASDGSASSVAYTPSTGAGKWQPTPPANLPALLPQWAQLRPFAMTRSSQFSPNGIPALTSAAYATALNEVKEIGSLNSATRTADQTAIAKFWSNGAGTATPPGHLNRLAQGVAEQFKNSLSQNARLFALLNVAMADAAIMAWNTKYATDFWRPITAIRAASSDGNNATTQDDTWTPFLTTPPFSSYVSGHASFSGAASVVLSSFFGTDAVGFQLPSEDPSVATRSYTSFSQAAKESADSRLYGGIHFSFDNADGLKAGNALGKFVFDGLMTPQIRPSVAAIVGTDLVVYGDERADAITFTLKRNDLVVWNRGIRLGEFPLSSFSNLIVDGRSGNDWIFVGPSLAIPSTLLGGNGNDQLHGGRGVDRLFGGEGLDFLFGYRGDDQLFGESGNDQLFGGDDNDSLDGGSGNDFLFGELGHDQLFGGEGDDWLYGGPGDDLLNDTRGKNRLFKN